jgi:hypothetical protein
VVPVDPPAVFDGEDSTLAVCQNVGDVGGGIFKFGLALFRATYIAPVVYVTI